MSESDFGWLDLLAILAFLLVLGVLIFGMLAGLAWMLDWFWNNVVCENWIVCQ